MLHLFRKKTIVFYAPYGFSPLPPPPQKNLHLFRKKKKTIYTVKRFLTQPVGQKNTSLKEGMWRFGDSGRGANRPPKPRKEEEEEEDDCETRSQEANAQVEGENFLFETGTDWKFFFSLFATWDHDDKFPKSLKKYFSLSLFLPTTYSETSLHGTLLGAHRCVTRADSLGRRSWLLLCRGSTVCSTR